MIDYDELLKQLELDLAATEARHTAILRAIVGVRSIIAHPEPPRTASGSVDAHRHSTATSPENEKSAPEERSTQTIAITEVSDDDQ